MKNKIQLKIKRKGEFKQERAMGILQRQLCKYLDSGEADGGA